MERAALWPEHIRARQPFGMLRIRMSLPLWRPPQKNYVRAGGKKHKYQFGHRDAVPEPIYIYEPHRIFEQPHITSPKGFRWPKRAHCLCASARTISPWAPQWVSTRPPRSPRRVVTTQYYSHTSRWCRTLAKKFCERLLRTRSLNLSLGTANNFVHRIPNLHEKLNLMIPKTASVRSCCNPNQRLTPPNFSPHRPRNMLQRSGK